MQVEPSRLVELAATSESLLTGLLGDWSAAQPDLAGACSALGDTTGADDLAAAYAESLADADDVVSTLAQGLHLGVEGLVAAAHDALSADDTVATELGRATSQVADVGGRSHHGRHGHGRGGR